MIAPRCNVCDSCRNGGRSTRRGKRPMPPIRVISCGVFRPAVDHLELEKKYPHLSFEYLSPHLHLFPDKLRDCLIKHIRGAKPAAGQIVCLYGDCFPDIDDVCKSGGASRIIGANCYEILLGTGRFRSIMDETAGTYFLERALVENFQAMCAGPLELFDEEMRREIFRHYKRVVYVRQPADPDLVGQASEIARFLELSLEVLDSDYSHFERGIVELIRRRSRRGSVR